MNAEIKTFKELSEQHQVIVLQSTQETVVVAIHKDGGHSTWQYFGNDGVKEFYRRLSPSTATALPLPYVYEIKSLSPEELIEIGKMCQAV